MQDMTNFIVRKQLEKMLAWKTGIRTDFQVSVGKSAKYLYRWLDAGEYQEYLDTYFGGDIEGAWAAVLRMCSLFERTSEYVARELGYTYNDAEDRAARSYLEHVRDLPEDADGIY